MDPATKKKVIIAVAVGALGVLGGGMVGLVFLVLLSAMPIAACEVLDDLPVASWFVDCDQEWGSYLAHGDQCTTPVVPADANEFVRLYGQYAYDVGEEYDIPYDAILAQAALESGWGASQLTVEAFNFFGIKAGSDWDGPVYTIETQEQNPDGSTYTVVADFRKYQNAEEGFTGYAEFIHNNSRYAEALNYPNDPVQYLTEIRAAGYATDVNYVDKVVGILESIQAIIRDGDLFPPSSEISANGATAGGIGGPYETAPQATAQTAAGSALDAAAIWGIGGASPRELRFSTGPTHRTSNAPEHNGPLAWPVNEGTPIPDGGHFGDPRDHGPHEGLDFSGPLGDPIFAVADGEVTFAGPTDDGYGFLIKIEHEIDGQTVETRYAHMPDANEEVNEGDTVQAGQRIASIGQAGNSTGPHLHFEVRINGEAQDPAVWLEENGATGNVTPGNCGGNGDISGVDPPDKDSNGNWPAETCSVEPDPSNGAECVTPRTATLVEMLYAWGIAEGDISCNENRSSGEHPLGRACDVTMGAIGTEAAGADKDMGDRLAEFLKSNADTWAIEYVIWYGEIWTVARADEGWRPYTGSVSGCDVTTTTCGHFDHVHITVY